MTCPPASKLRRAAACLCASPADMLGADDLECSKGTAPQAAMRLQRPNSSSSHFKVHQTCWLYGSPAPDTLAAACSVTFESSNVVITYDIETQCAKRLLFGHLGEILDMAAAPAAWHGAPHVFATAARSGDVKIWDVRNSGGAAAITLAGGSDREMHAVAFVANNPSSSSSSSGSQLGSGLYCFAGGSGQSVWAWDLRGGQGRVLYELSSGILDVTALGWHEGSSSLIASCDSSYQDRWVVGRLMPCHCCCYSPYVSYGSWQSSGKVGRAAMLGNACTQRAITC
jgi:WD40 repeat protein